MAALSIAEKVATPCVVEFGGETITSPQHGWWHAAGVTRHLVCVSCGLGLHGLTPLEMATTPHSVFGDAGLRPCTATREVAW